MQAGRTLSRSFTNSRTHNVVYTFIGILSFRFEVGEINVTTHSMVSSFRVRSPLNSGPNIHVPPRNIKTESSISISPFGRRRAESEPIRWGGSDGWIPLRKFGLFPGEDLNI
jgi:hypothetical protein